MAKTKEKSLYHEGYHGSVEFSLEDELLHGRIMNIRDTITYDGPDVASLKAAFKLAVEEYLAFCKEVGDEPEKPFSGTFNVRIERGLHRGAVIAADHDGVSLNKWVEDAIDQKINPKALSPVWVERVVVALRQSGVGAQAEVDSDDLGPELFMAQGFKRKLRVVA